MEAIKFNLSGPTAFFKKPDVNSFAFFTYNNIHKIALLGMLGAIIGLKGHNQLKDKNDFPEFYEQLNQLKVSIVPKSQNGYFTKKMQVFTNNTGFYNTDSNKIPCSLIVREQWLENVSWDIYILLENENIDSNILNKLKDYLMNKECEFIPYLGKNEHKADITDVELINLEELRELNRPIRMHSLIKTDDFEITGKKYQDDVRLILMKELLPVGLDSCDHSYKFNQFTFTNLLTTLNGSNLLIYKHLDSNLYFF